MKQVFAITCVFLLGGAFCPSLAHRALRSGRIQIAHQSDRAENAALTQTGYALAHKIKMLTGVSVLQLLKDDPATGRPNMDASTLAQDLHKQMDLEDAMKQLDGSLPDDVAQLVSVTVKQRGSGTTAKFAESSLQKARSILNNMILDAWGEMDDVVFECKEFEERNRGTYEQVVGDLERLASQLSQLGNERVDANQGIADQDRMRKAAEAEITKETTSFNAKKLLDDQEITIRKNDLAVFDMILMMTKCPDPTFIQLVSKRQAENSFKLCAASDGITIHFDDPKLQAKVERVMTPEGRRKLREALGQLMPKMPSLFLQLSGTTSNTTTTTAGLPSAPPDTSPVVEEPPAAGQARKCVDGTPNCGLLHDLMSMEWGKFRDAFDELTAEMLQDQDAYDKILGDLNTQLTTISDARTKHMEALAQAISSTNADTEESNEKDEEKLDLSDAYDKKMAECSAKISEILFTQICAVRKVRNEIMVTSTISPPAGMTDCDFTDWYPQDGNCFAPSGAKIDCDDTCPQADPYACGGMETMVRDVVIAPNQYGMACPSLSRQKKCKQIKCPVNCVMSEWSGFSKCSKDCEGGVKLRTRSILTKAKNGGEACDTVQESVGCNTESCDRDCTLDVWTEWAPCSMACGAGLTNRIRKVDIPIRGLGKCPTTRSSERYHEKTCNAQACVGDEICVATQDLVLAIDASGSLKAPGYEVVRTFAENVTSSYVGMFYGKQTMSMGVVLFGNGHLITQPDGTTSIASAIVVQHLTSDIAAVGQAIAGTAWQQGFTNMAQAFQEADIVLSQGGRADAQSAVMVISDGKASMAYQTAEKAQELKDKGVMIFMVAISEAQGPELENIRKWASQPWETNYVHIPGLQALKYNSKTFATEAIAKFCPKAMSPSAQKAIEDDLQCLKLREDGEPNAACAKVVPLEGIAGDEATCAFKVREAGGLAFLFGKGQEAGRCDMVDLPISDADFDNWQNNRTNPGCAGGQWMPNPFFDVYVCKASSDPCGPGGGYGKLDIATSTLAQSDIEAGGALRYAGIGEINGEAIDLEVTADGSYQAPLQVSGTGSGMTGDFGKVRLRACASTTFTFSWMNQATAAPQEMAAFTFFVFDVDRSSTKYETFTFSGHASVEYPMNPAYSVQQTSDSIVLSAQGGAGSPGPNDPMELTEQMKRHAMAIKYVNTTTFTVGFSVECEETYENQPIGGRALYFGFHSDLIPCQMR